MLLKRYHCSEYDRTKTKCTFISSSQTTEVQNKNHSHRFSVSETVRVPLSFTLPVSAATTTVISGATIFESSSILKFAAFTRVISISKCEKLRVLLRPSYCSLYIPSHLRNHAIQTSSKFALSKHCSSYSRRFRYLGV